MGALTGDQGHYYAYCAATASRNASMLRQAPADHIRLHTCKRPSLKRQRLMQTARLLPPSSGAGGSAPPAHEGQSPRAAQRPKPERILLSAAAQGAPPMPAGAGDVRIHSSAGGRDEGRGPTRRRATPQSSLSSKTIPHPTRPRSTISSTLISAHVYLDVGSNVGCKYASCTSPPSIPRRWRPTSVQAILWQ